MRLMLYLQHCLVVSPTIHANIKAENKIIIEHTCIKTINFNFIVIHFKQILFLLTIIIMILFSAFIFAWIVGETTK